MILFIYVILFHLPGQQMHIKIDYYQKACIYNFMEGTILFSRELCGFYTIIVSYNSFNNKQTSG